MQGQAVPMIWNAETQSTVAKNLGFDPESPMVKMEMSRIIGRGRVSGSDIFKDIESFVTPTSGYREIVVSFEAPSSPPSNPRQTLPEPAPNKIQQTAPIAASDSPADHTKTILALAAIAVAVIIAGSTIVLKKRIHPVNGKVAPRDRT